MAYIYYKVPASSDLGRKLQEVERKYDDIRTQCKVLCDEFGTDAWGSSRNPFVFLGGFDSFIFKTPPANADKWKVTHYNGNSFYEPKKNTKWGKELAKRMDEVGVISIHDMMGIFNAKSTETHRYVFCIGIKWEKDGFFKIGYNNDRWIIPMLAEFDEITCSEYER